MMINEENFNEKISLQDDEGDYNMDYDGVD